MCQLPLFFIFLLLYFVLLVFFTLERKFVTYKGIFFFFTLFLSIFIPYLIGLFNSIVMWGGLADFFLELNVVNWLALEVSISLRLDTLSYLFTLLVCIIGLGTNFYILNYFKYEANEDIFALLINWFMLSMIILVLANNLFTLFLGWESIGLSSFFLINFWSTRRGTVKSSFKAFFFNKISDVFLLIFLISLNFILYTNSLSVINLKLSWQLFTPTYLYKFTSACLFICTLFKSAQLIGHLWLPDSMEAPVPASALIHSATLVSAGVYLLIRFNILLFLNNMQFWMLLVGSVTAAYGALVSSSQTDIKKLLAYSTISHCGFLFVTIGTEVFVTTILYLFLHGLFKALTFFCAGSFIRVAGSQDTRQMGALNRVLPVDTTLLLICAFNLGGLPFSLGYLYKSALLTSILNTYIYVIVIGFCTIGALCSIIYTYRLVYYSAFDTAKEFFLQILYDLQQKQTNIVAFWSLTTYVQIIAALLLLSFTLWFYVAYFNQVIFSCLILEHPPITLMFNTNYLTTGANIYKSYYELFYAIYLLVIFIIILVAWRVEYTFMYKLNFFVTINLSFLAFTVITIIL